MKLLLYFVSLFLFVAASPKYFFDADMGNYSKINIFGEVESVQQIDENTMILTLTNGKKVTLKNGRIVGDLSAFSSHSDDENYAGSYSQTSNMDANEMSEKSKKASNFDFQTNPLILQLGKAAQQIKEAGTDSANSDTLSNILKPLSGLVSDVLNSQNEKSSQSTMETVSSNLKSQSEKISQVTQPFLNGLSSGIESNLLKLQSDSQSNQESSKNSNSSNISKTQSEKISQVSQTFLKGLKSGLQSNLLKFQTDSQAAMGSSMDSSNLLKSQSEQITQMMQSFLKGLSSNLQSNLLKFQNDSQSNQESSKESEKNSQSTEKSGSNSLNPQGGLLDQLTQKSDGEPVADLLSNALNLQRNQKLSKNGEQNNDTENASQQTQQNYQSEKTSQTSQQSYESEKTVERNGQSEKTSEKSQQSNQSERSSQNNQDTSQSEKASEKNQENNQSEKTSPESNKSDKDSQQAQQSNPTGTGSQQPQQNNQSETGSQQSQQSNPTGTGSQQTQQNNQSETGICKKYTDIPNHIQDAICAIRKNSENAVRQIKHAMEQSILAHKNAALVQIEDTGRSYVSQIEQLELNNLRG